MLQTNTGMLFPKGVGHTNDVNSVLYSNVGAMQNEITTMGGNLHLMVNQDFPYAISYSYVERIEKSDPQEVENPNTSEILEEFSVLATFGLQAIFSPEREQVRILTDNKAYSYQFQDKLVRRIFDSHVNLGAEDIHDFEELVQDFLMLDRKVYETAKKAINRYAMAIGHISGNPTMAYTTLVSAIDVLIPEDYSIQNVQRKNTKQQWKFSTRGNFIKYLIDNIDIELLASDTEISDFPIRTRELLMLLHNAYSIRSKFIHNSVLLPEVLKTPSNFAEVMEIGGSFYLTLQGLVRIARQIIINFIRNGKKMDIELFRLNQEKVSENDGDIILLPSYSKEPESYDFRRQFNDMLTLSTKVLIGYGDIDMTDSHSVLNEIESKIEDANESDQVTMLAMHALYNWTVTKEQRSVNYLELVEKFKHLMVKPYPENLITTMLTQTHDWSLGTHQTALDQYWKERYKKNKVIGGPMFEAAFYLEFAERHRTKKKKNAKDEEKSKKDVKALIGRAVKDFPNHPKLRKFESEYDGEKPINWLEILEIDKETDGKKDSSN